MISSEIRAKARESLTGKWGKAALITLAYIIITFVIQLVCRFIPIIGSIIIIVISTPISYGLAVSFMKLKRGEEVNYTDFFNDGFNSFGKVWGVVGNTILKMILPICLLIISIFLLLFGASGTIFGLAAGYTTSKSVFGGMAAGFGFLGVVGLILYFASLVYIIVKGYLYSLTMYILYDKPDMTSKEIVEESERLMQGNRWRFFWLGLTFIGWAILAGLSLGIGMLWLMPYMMVATICFYEDLAGKNDTNIIAENKTEE